MNELHWQYELMQACFMPIKHPEPLYRHRSSWLTDKEEVKEKKEARKRSVCLQRVAFDMFDSGKTAIEVSEDMQEDLKKIRAIHLKYRRERGLHVNKHGHSCSQEMQNYYDKLNEFAEKLVKKGWSANEVYREICSSNLLVSPEGRSLTKKNVVNLCARLRKRLNIALPPPKKYIAFELFDQGFNIYQVSEKIGITVGAASSYKYIHSRKLDNANLIA